MSKIYNVKHKKSNVLLNGSPKLPAANTLDYGEIAINYAQSGETLSIKNSADQIVTFPCENRVQMLIDSAVTQLETVIQEDEFVTAHALNDLNDRINGLSMLPSVTSNDNGKVMMVVDGAWALVTPTTV